MKSVFTQKEHRLKYYLLIIFICLFQVSAFAADGKNQNTEVTQDRSTLSHSVKKGESYYTIAKKYQVFYKDLQKLNKNKVLIENRKIAIPDYVFYKIKKGDYWGKIYKTCHCSHSDLMILNPGLKVSSPLLEGKYLRLPRGQTKLPVPDKKLENKKNLGAIQKETQARSSSAGRAPFTWQWPVKGQLKKDYGEEASIFSPGLWFSANDKKVCAAAAGQVVYSGPLRGYGYVILLEHQKGWFSFYGGLNERLPSSGEKVSAGKAIGTAQDEMVFFSIFYQGEVRNPREMIRAQLLP